MANQIQRVILLDSQRHAVMQFYAVADGSGDLKNEPILDPTIDFQNSTFQYQGVSLGLDELWWDSATVSTNTAISGFLTFDSSTTPQLIWPLSPNPGDTHLDFRSIGGIKDKTGIDGTGKLLVTTNNFTDVGATLAIIVSVKKYSRPASQYPMGAIGGPVSESINNLEVPGNSGSA